MQLFETSAPVGVLTISTDDKVLFCEKNVIVSPAKNALLQMLYTGGLSSDPITSLQIGTGGTIDSQGLYPKQENPNQSSLSAYLLTLTTTYTANPGSNSVTFLATADTNTGNNSLISEAALFKTSGNMFNIKNFPGVYKTSYFALYFRWTITFP